MNDISPEFQLAIFQYKTALSFYGESRQSRKALKKVMQVAPQWFKDELGEDNAND